MISRRDLTTDRLAATSQALRRRLTTANGAVATGAPVTSDSPPSAPTSSVGDHELAALDPLQGFAALLPPGPGRTVVVLAHPTVRSRLAAWLLPFYGDDVHVVAGEAVPDWPLEAYDVSFHPGGTLDEMSWQIRLIGAVDVLVNLVPATIAEHNVNWQRLYYYLKPGGAYVVSAETNEHGAFGSDLTSWLRYLSNAEDPAVTPRPSARQREFAASTATVAASRDLVVLKKQQRHYVKLRETHASRLLALRDEGLTVTELTRLPAGDVESKAQVTSHESSVPIPALSDRLHHPQLFLRHYQGRVGFAGSTLMFSDYTILPDSFRHHLQPDLSNPLLKNVSVTFARVPEQHMPKETLEGNYYQLDSSFSGHFGHFTTEVLAKLWGWDLAKQIVPDLKALFSLKTPHQRIPGLERRFFTAYGIADEDIVWVDRPVHLESVVSATPMWHNSDPHYVHPQMAEVWQRLGERLVDPDAPEYERIFISRATQTERRTCRNVHEVEAYFAAHGFTVIYPELLDLRIQAGIFAKATTIAGFGGSAMFNVMHAKKMKTMILLSHEAYTARNEHLFTALLGGQVHYFWSKPDVAHPEGGWTQGAFYSDWEFDFARNEQPLDALLAAL